MQICLPPSEASVPPQPTVNTADLYFDIPPGAPSPSLSVVLFRPASFGSRSMKYNKYNKTP